MKFIDTKYTPNNKKIIMKAKYELLLESYNELDEALDMVVEMLYKDYPSEDILKKLFDKLGGLQ